MKLFREQSLLWICFDTDYQVPSALASQIRKDQKTQRFASVQQPRRVWSSEAGRAEKSLLMLDDT